MQFISSCGRFGSSIRHAWLSLGLLVLASVSGCSPAASRRAAVSGTIRVDGAPLKEGAIAFFPIQPTIGPSAAGVITDGLYDIPRAKGPVIGGNRVEIRAFRKTGRKSVDHWNPDEPGDEVISALGPEYNRDSTLARDIRDGQNQLNFDLPGVGTDRP